MKHEKLAILVFGGQLTSLV